MSRKSEPHGTDELADDFLSTVGLILNVAAVISLALWLSMAGSGSHGASAGIAGTLTIVLFGVSILCFVAEGPADQQSERVQGGESVVKSVVIGV